MLLAVMPRTSARRRPVTVNVRMIARFQEVRNASTPVIAERVVADIDEIVRLVRFPGWQDTQAGDREMRQSLRRVLLKYQLHREQELFDRAYAYIRQYY